MVAGLMTCGCATAPREPERAVLIKAHILFRDPEERQPIFECKSDKPGVEVICLRYPNSYTVDVRDVLIGSGLPRRLHAILWVHTEPSKEVDLYIAGKRKPSGEVEAFRWGELQYVGCALNDLAGQAGTEEQIQALQRASGLPCAAN